MSVIRGVPHFDFYIAEPQSCILSYGHRLTDTAEKIAQQAVTYASDDRYRVSTNNISGGVRPGFRYMKFAKLLAFDALYANADNSITTNTNFRWNVDFGTWAEAIPQGVPNRLLHFVDNAPNASGQVSSQFSVPKNCSLVFPLYRYGLPDGADIANYPGTVIIQFGKIWQLVLYNTGQPPELRKQGPGGFNVVSTGSTSLFPVNEVNYVAVEIVDRYIVITNGIHAAVQSQDSQQSPWIHYDRDPQFVNAKYSNSRSEQILKPIITKSSKVIIQIRNQAAFVGLWYYEYANNETITSPKFITDQYYRTLPLTLTLPTARAEAQFRVPEGQSGDVLVELNSHGNNGVFYELTMISGDNRFTPFLFEVNVQIGPDRQPIRRFNQVAISSEFVEAASLTSTTEEITGSITVNNFGGRFRNVTGVHGCAIDTGWHYNNEQTLAPSPVGRAYGFNLYRKFTGYFQKTARSRTGPTDSKIQMPLISRDQQAKDAIAVNLPIFDGACEIYSFLEIFYRAGCLDDPSEPVRVFNPTTRRTSTVYTIPGILAWQDPWSGRYQTLRNYWKNFGGYDPGSSRECRLGLCNHPILPSSTWNAAPKIKFELGTSLWDCALELRKWTLPWLFYNNWGNCVIFYNIQPDLRNIMYNWFSQPIGTFREIPQSTPFEELGYNGFHSLGLDLDVENVRNALLAMGLDEDNLVPLLSVFKSDLRNGDAFNYIPWYKWVNPIPRSPFWSTIEHVNRVALNLYLRARRPRPEVNFTSWGQPAVFPYTLVELIEGTSEPGTSREVFPDELARASQLFRIVGMNENFDFTEKNYTMQASAEWQDALSFFYYDPVF